MLKRIIEFSEVYSDVLKATKASSLLERFDVLRKLGKKIMPEYRFKWPQMDWWNDNFFNTYLSKFNEIEGMNTDRRWMLYQLMRLVETVDGDTAECGVYQGAGSYVICKMNKQNKFNSRSHYIFDSFEGLSDPAIVDGTHWTKGDLCYEIEKVERNLSDCTNFSLYKGWIPDRFIDVENKKFAFVHIDVDLYEPTKESFEFFYRRMNTNGIILCDDYGFTSCPGATKAIDEFLEDKPEKMIFLSAGGGFMIKSCQTSVLIEI